MTGNSIFLFEYITGGGFNRFDIPASLFCEGFGMLKSLINDFHELKFDISTLIDERISKLSENLPINSHTIEKKDDFLSSYAKELKRHDYCLIIAPEFQNILYNLTELATKNNKKLLSIGLDGIRKGTSKIETFHYFRDNTLPTPPTYQIPTHENRLDKRFILKKLEEFGSLIIKPKDGVGTESIFFMDTPNQIEELFSNYNEIFEQDRQYILQKYINGIDLSCSIVRDIHDNCQILSINSQNLIFKNTKDGSEYFGGSTPADGHRQIKPLIKKHLSKVNLSPYIGFFGIDFILKSDKTPEFIEINPRVTTPYVGISQISEISIAKLILESYNSSIDPEASEINGHSLFTRLELGYPKDLDLEHLRTSIIPKIMRKYPEIIVPPISFGQSLDSSNFQFSCFIATKEKDAKHSLEKLQKIKSRLRKDNFLITR